MTLLEGHNHMSKVTDVKVSAFSECFLLFSFFFLFDSVLFFLVSVRFLLEPQTSYLIPRYNSSVQFKTQGGIFHGLRSGNCDLQSADWVGCLTSWLITRWDVTQPGHVLGKFVVKVKSHKTVPKTVKYLISDTIWPTDIKLGINVSQFQLLHTNVLTLSAFRLAEKEMR